MSRSGSSFSELLAELYRIYPPFTERLAPPAPKSEIERLEAWLGVSVPEEARAVYRLHDGQGESKAYTVYSRYLLSINEALDQLALQRGGRESGIVLDDLLEDQRLSQGFPSAFHVPLLSDDTGNFVGYDVRPRGALRAGAGVRR